MRELAWQSWVTLTQHFSYHCYQSTSLHLTGPPLVMHPNPIELILLRAVLTRPGPIYFRPFRCTCKFHVNSISLFLGRKQHWLIPSSSWRCPLSQWARGMCLWGDWRRGGGLLWVLHRQRTGPHICLLHIGSMWTKGGDGVYKIGG